MKSVRKRNPQAGSTILETVIATALMFTVAAGVMGLGALALATTENQGHLTARTSEYCQDKLEQLLALSFNDSSSNTSVVPTTSTGGNGLTIGGGTNPTSPVSGYVDYLDSSGNILTASGSTAPANWFYIRVWSIAAGPAGSGTEKLITVTTEVDNQVGSVGGLPESTVAALKVNPF
jgi:hypothetical protein